MPGSETGKNYPFPGKKFGKKFFFSSRFPRETGFPLASGQNPLKDSVFVVSKKLIPELTFLAEKANFIKTYCAEVLFSPFLGNLLNINIL